MNMLGFIGLGTMGGPMAANLLKAGYSVTVHNRTPGRANELSRLGADIVESPAEVARSADIVFTMVSNDEALHDVYYGEAGIISALRPGMTLVDCSTVSPSLSEQLHRELASHYAAFFDAPVTGSLPAAVDGKLVFMAGGESRERLDELGDVLLAMGSAYHYMGQGGAGARTKLALNAIVGINMAALVEGLALAQHADIDPELFLSLVLSGGASSRMAELKQDKLLDRDFATQFALKHMLKDLRLASREAAALSVPMPLLHSAETAYTIAQAQGLGELDLSALMRSYESWLSGTIGRSGQAAAREQHAGQEAGSAAAKGLHASQASRSSEQLLTDDAGKRGDSDAAGDKRRSIRVPLDIALQISIYQWEQEGSFSGHSLVAALYDLSEGGMQIICDVPLAKEMFLVIHFPQEAALPPITGKIIRIERRNDTFHYGCLISGLAPYTKKKLDAYIQHHMNQLYEQQ